MNVEARKIFTLDALNFNLENMVKGKWLFTNNRITNLASFGKQILEVLVEYVYTSTSIDCFKLSFYHKKVNA